MTPLGPLVRQILLVETICSMVRQIVGDSTLTITATVPNP